MDQRRRPLGIDPRFARRWAQVRREQGRRRLRVVTAAVALVAVAGLAAGSLYSPLFEIRHVRISTVGSVPRAEILSVTGLSHRRPLIDVDTGAMARRLDAVADLGGASVHRSWPGTVRIRVVVRTPIALVAQTTPAGAPTGWSTVDATGRILADVKAPVPGLPVLQGVGPIPGPGAWLAGSTGPGVAPPVAAGPALADLSAAADSPAAPTGPAAALAVVAALPASVRAQVLSVTVGPGNQMTMAVLPDMVAGSIPVALGDGSQLAEKLTALVALLTQANLSGVAGVNLTVPDRPAVLTARQTPGTVSTHAGG